MVEGRGELFEELVGIMERLRGPHGCPWDREQTRESIRPYLIEEAYEVLEALDEGDLGKYREELGDLLLQVVFHAQLAAEQGEFTIDDVLKAISGKLIKRHPHVFGGAKMETAEEVLAHWEAEKSAERRAQGGSALDGVPKELPALLRAHRLQEKTSRIGFDWKEAKGVFEKVEEELRELKAAAEKGEAGQVEAELGDFLFALVNLSRFLRVNPEEALRKSIDRFIARFRYIEQEMAGRGKDLEEASLEELDELWEEAKKTLDPLA